MVKIFPSATDTVENPLPIPCAFHASGGPPSGHFFSSPVSVDRLSRLGPCHCGQGLGAAHAPTLASAIRAPTDIRIDVVSLMNPPTPSYPISPWSIMDGGQ